MVITHSNVPYLLTNLRKHKIRCFINSVGNPHNLDKRAFLQEAFVMYLSQPENHIYRKAIQNSPLYDDGKCTGLVTRFINDI